MPLLTGVDSLLLAATLDGIDAVGTLVAFDDCALVDVSASLYEDVLVIVEVSVIVVAAAAVLAMVTVGTVAAMET